MNWFDGAFVEKVTHVVGKTMRSNLIRLIQKMSWPTFIFCILMMLVASDFSYFELAIVFDLKKAFLMFLLLSLSIATSSFFFALIAKESCGLENSQVNTIFIVGIESIKFKYLPGGIWQFVNRLHKLKQWGVGNAKLMRLTLFEIMVPPFSAMVVGGLCVVFMMTYIGGAVSVGLILLLLCLYSYRVRNINLITLSVIAVLHWLVVLLAFGLFASFYNFGLISSGLRYLFAWAIGNLAFFSPQGVGVTEFAYMLFSDSQFESFDIVIIVAAFRIVLLLTDFFFLSFWAVATRLLLTLQSCLR